MNIEEKYKADKWDMVNYHIVVILIESNIQYFVLYKRK